MAADLGGAVMAAVLELRNLSLGYPDLALFKHLSLDMKAGTTLAVLGANGSGKSTFVKMLLGLVDPLAGRLHWPSGRPGEIGYLAQLTEFDRRFPIRVRDLVAMGAWRGFGLWSGLGRGGRNRVAAALEEAGIPDLADRSLHTLSGGQLQRALFARVILQDAPLILLDEPFAAVDQSTEAHLLSIIKRWREEDRAVVLVVHDLSSVLDHCSHVLLLGNGTATHGSVAEVLTPDLLVAHGYLSQSQASWMFRGSIDQKGQAHA
ncbi:metal ABC transporter ATP-binding protein [Roseibium sp.]|uniref:metal ABC transporter ATP-binding protein n=1 Tax=Roseibium sp. TaxID=1936156 RepID=UPI003B508C75